MFDSSEMVSGKSPDWLPAGWTERVKDTNGRKIKCYIDPLTGCEFYSKSAVCEYLRTVKRNSCTSQQNETGIDSVSNPSTGELTGVEASLNIEGSQNMQMLKCASSASKQKQMGFSKQSVVIVRVTPEGLPPGWIKEIKFQKKASGTRKDPYYTDPVSGYVFCSQKDALRYLKTGDLNRCAIKPKKRDELGFLNEETSLPSAAIMQKVGQHMGRELFAGTENRVKSSLETMDAEGSLKKEMIVCADATITTTSMAEILEGKHSPDDVIEECVDTKESYEPSSSPLPRTEGSERKRGKIDPSISKNKKSHSLPCRASKRLAGLKPEMVGNMGLSEHALRAAARDSGGTEANPSSETQDNVAYSALHQFPTISETEIADPASRGKHAPSNVEMSNRSKKPSDDQSFPEDQPVRQETEKKDEGNLESELLYPFGDSWSDPCLEFAFKTLTGVIPVEDNFAIQGYFQQQVGTSHAQSDGCLALPEFNVPNFFQSNISSNFDASGNTVSEPQLATNPTFLPRGNVSLPSCGSAPQQPNLEGNKEQTKVNS